MVVAIIGRWVLTDRDKIAVVVVDRGSRQIAADVGPRRIIPRGLPLPSEGSIHFLIWIEFLISLIVGISSDAWVSS
jgi:hypothetical protein